MKNITQKDKRLYEKAFQAYQQGESLRDLSKVYGKSKSSFSYYFKLLYGDSYTEQKNAHGLTPIIDEFINNSTNERDKEIARKWLNDNAEKIKESDRKNINTPLYTKKRMDTNTFNQCIIRDNTWFENIYQDIEDEQKG